MKPLESILRIIAIADKEWIQIRRDIRSLILSIIAPALLILLFGYALTVDVKYVSTAVLDQDKSPMSRHYLEKFSHTDYISINHYVNNSKKIDKLLNTGSIVMGIVIPVDFEKNYSNGKDAEVQVIIDGTDSTAATVALGYAKGITSQFNQEIMEKEFKRAGLNNVRIPINMQTRMWYNPELKSKNFIIPGLIAMIMAIISALITSLTISREWERGSMETLITTPVKSFEVIFGKLIPYIFIGMFDVLLAQMIGYFVFNVPMKGSFMELSLVSVLFLIGSSGMGILISSVLRVQVLSVQVALVVTFLPSLILSGFIYPIREMPLFVQAITCVVPARYMIAISKNISLKGIDYTLLWGEIIFLFLFALAVVTLAVKKFSVMLPEK